MATAYRVGKPMVEDDHRLPLLRTAGIAPRRDRAGPGYRFEGDRALFRCPSCHQWLRSPLDRELTLKGGTCARTVAVRTGSVGGDTGWPGRDQGLSPGSLP